MELAYTPPFHDRLSRLLQERLEEHLGALSDGAASDFSDYRYRCGQIAAIREALAMAEDVRKFVLEH